MANNSLVFKIGADIREFLSGMENADRQMKKLGRQMRDVGQNMSATLTLPIVAAGAAAIKSAADFEKMQVSLRTAFQGNEAAAEKAFETINEFTAKTPFQLEEVMGAFVKLKNMGLDPSMGALTSYGNTASAMGKNLNDMVEAVADAATGEFERLKEFGIRASSQGDQVAFTFRGVTTTVAKNSEEIQQYLLNIGNTDFAGGMEAQSQTLYGQLSTLQDTVKLLAADFGNVLLPVIKPMIESVRSMAERFRELEPNTKKIILVVGGLVAAIGPLLVAMGTLVPLLPGIAAGLAALTGPIGLVVAAIAGAAALIIANWDEISEYFTSGEGAAIWTTLKESVDGIMSSMVDIWKNGTALLSELWAQWGESIMAVIQFSLQPAIDFIALMFEQIGNIFAVVGAALQGDWDAVWKGIANIFITFANFFIGKLEGLVTGVIGIAGKLARAFGADGLADSMDTAKKKVSEFADAMKFAKFESDEIEPKISKAKEAVDQLGESAKNAGTQMQGLMGGGRQRVEGISMESIGTDEALGSMQSDQGPFSDDFIQSIRTATEEYRLYGDALQYATEKKRLLQAEITNLIENGHTVESEAVKKLKGDYDELTNKTIPGIVEGQRTLKSAAIDAATAFTTGFAQALVGAEDFNQAMGRLIRDTIRMLLIEAIAGFAAKSLATMGPLGLAAAAAAPIVVGGLFDTVIPPFADGGIVSGPTLGLMGEYTGASTNPEVIAPLDKLKSMLGGVGGMGNMQLTTRIEGQDLLVMLQEAETQQEFTRGYN